jgi:polysaccharide biosynthesis protein PslH
MTTPVRLLFLSHRLPYPPHSGAAIRTWNILRLLAAEFEVEGLCFDRPDRHLAHVPLADRMAAMNAQGRFALLPIPQLASRARLAADHLRSVATGRPYTWYVHESRAAQRALAEVLRRFDPHVVHVDSMDMVRLLPLLEGRPTVVTHHNVESQLLARRSVGAGAAWRQGYLRLQADHLRRAEAEWMPRVALNVVVSPEDERVFREIAPAASYAVVPNGVDVDYFRPVLGPTEGCVFVGGTTWHPNRDALVWFTSEILPRLRARGERGPVTWVGRVTEEERRAFEGVEGFHLTGYVDDIRPHLARATCFIAPLRFGGGTRLKLLDAWAMGKAIVSTGPGAEGLGGVDGRDLLLAENPEAFADAVARVLRDPGLAALLGAGGRRAVEERFSWTVIGRQMSDLYRAVAEAGRSGSG